MVEGGRTRSRSGFLLEKFMKYEIKLYHNENSLDDEFYTPFTAVCSYDEMSRLMLFALQRGYIVMVSTFDEEDKA